MEEIALDILKVMRSSNQYIDFTSVYEIWFCVYRNITNMYTSNHIIITEEEKTLINYDYQPIQGKMYKDDTDLNNAIIGYWSIIRNNPNVFKINDE